MKTSRLIIALVALGAAIVWPLHVRASGPDLNLKAQLYSANLVQAMDQCASAVTNVGGVGGCTPSNSSTDGTHFNLGRVLIRSRFGRSQVATALRSSSASPPGALAGKTVHVVIMLRVTRTIGSPPVTWVDQTLDCPNIPVGPTGDVVQKVSLTDCGLAAALADNTTNKEVLAVQVINNGSGKPIAVPGTRRKN